MKKIWARNVVGQTYFMKEPDTQNDIFHKKLFAYLFNNYDSLFSESKTLFIDNSLIKHMLNPLEKVLLLPTWSYELNIVKEY